MPISYKIDPQQRLIFTTAKGVLTGEEVMEHKQLLLHDPAFEPGMRELSDVRCVERLEVTPAGIQHMVAMDKSTATGLDDYRLAIVASADVIFGMARMYQALTEDNIQSVRVFRSIEEAKDWLLDFDG